MSKSSYSYFLRETCFIIIFFNFTIYKRRIKLISFHNQVKNMTYPAFNANTSHYIKILAL